MGSPLKPSPREDFSEGLSKWVDRAIFDASEFQKILEQTDLSDEEKEIILKSVESEEVKKILKINVTSHLYNLVANLTVTSAGLVTLAQSSSFQEAIEKGLGAYLGKLILSPLIAYIGWWKKKVHKKHKLAAWMLTPVAGDWLFLIRSLKVHHEQFLKFLVTYQETKRDFRRATSEDTDEHWEDFKNNLHNGTEKRETQSTAAQLMDLCVKNPIKNIVTSTQEKVGKQIDKIN